MTEHFLKHLSLPSNSIIVFDMGYNNYYKFKDWEEQQVTWVTRMMPTAWVEELSINPLTAEQQAAGVLEDGNVRLGRPSNKLTPKLLVRRIRYYDKENNKEFVFITNSKEFDAKTIADIYKSRWKIEMFFKRLKQYAPLRYFLGDNENAIRIQIWCAFIADLLVKVVKDRITKRKWAFSNIATSIIRQHLMTYINIFFFLSYPDKAFSPAPKNSLLQLKLNLYG